jgi:FkbM family methyltransferase
MTTRWSPYVRRVAHAFAHRVNRIANYFGVALSRTGPPGSVVRKIGSMDVFLADLAARGFQPAGIIDVGAHRGSWTKQASAIFPNAAVVMIEPQEEMRPTLATLARQRPHTEFIIAGAGAVRGESVLTIWEDQQGSSYIPKVDAAALVSGKQRVTEIITLDDVVAVRPTFQPDLVKLDVQGYEIEALKGASTLWGRTEVFILEVSLFRLAPDMPVLLDVLEFMAKHGYAVYDIAGFLRRPLDGALGQLDLALVRENGPFRRKHSWR